MYFDTECVIVVQDHPRSRTRVCNFLLVISSNLGPVLLPFTDIAGFLLRTVTLTLFDPNFGGVVLGLDSCNYF